MKYQGDQIDLFVALLVRFPQIGTIHYEPETNGLRIAFLLNKGQQDFQEFVRRTESHLALFHNLRQEKVSLASLKQIETGKLSTVEITRDLASLSLCELNLIVELVSDHYQDAVVREGQLPTEEDIFDQNLLIDALLMSNQCKASERLTGFRENGRVLVFSVPHGVSE